MSNKDARQIVELCSPVGYQRVYAISTSGRGPSNVASQQRRALNLAWALQASDIQPLDGASCWVFGAGAAGLTCAAGLKMQGCAVTVFDRAGEAMPFQKGCYHRFLHPRMVEWPARRSTSSSANLPILNWHAETADNVRKQILRGWRELGLPDIEPVGKFDVLPNGHVVFSDGAQRRKQPTFIVLALGFGVERAQQSLPRLSYWRLDSLDQPQLTTLDNPCKVIISGDGDGAVTDFLRATLRDFDHGPFINHACYLLKPLQEKVSEIEAAVRARRNRLQGAAPKLSQPDQDSLSRWLWHEYLDLARSAPSDEFRRLDEFLAQQERANVEVRWLGLSPTPMPTNTQPLHRLLAWRVLAGSGDKHHYTPGKLEQVNVLDQRRNTGPLYEASFSNPLDQSTPHFSLPCHILVNRTGPENSLERDLPALHQALQRRKRPEEPTFEDEHLRPEAAKVLAKASADHLKEVRQRPKLQVAQELKDEPELHIEFVGKVTSKSWPNKAGPDGATWDLALFELRLFVKGVDAEHTDITYLRYSEPKRPTLVSRAMKGFSDDRPFVLTIFTWSSYPIEVQVGTFRKRFESFHELQWVVDPTTEGASAKDIEAAKELLAKGETAVNTDEKLRDELRNHAHATGTDELKLIKERNLEDGLVEHFFAPCASRLVALSQEAWPRDAQGEWRVLDAGCGSGIIARTLRNAWLTRGKGLPNLQVDSFDSSVEAIQVAEAVTEQSAPADATNVKLSFHALRTDTFKPQTLYDQIFAQHLLLQLEDEEERLDCLDQFRKWLRPGGQLVVGVWDESCPLYEELYDHCGQASKKKTMGMSRDDFKSLLENAGFKGVIPETFEHQVEANFQEILEHYLRGSQFWLEQGLADRTALVKAAQSLAKEKMQLEKMQLRMNFAVGFKPEQT